MMMKIICTSSRQNTSRYRQLYSTLLKQSQWKTSRVRSLSPRTIKKGTIRASSNSTHPTKVIVREKKLDSNKIAAATRMSSNIAKPHKQIADPTQEQLKAHFLTCAVPMLGFGFMDNTVMIYAGNYIDCTIGVWFGLSTLAAAACGQIVANSASLVFGDTVERIARRVGLPNSNLTLQQRSLKVVNRVGLYGSLFGVIVGAILGLGNLLFIDAKQSEMLKLQALSQDQEFLFEIECSNTERPDATTVTVRGPDVDGVLASMTQALSAYGCSIVELHASPRDRAGASTKSGGSNTSEIFEDVFIVRPRTGGGEAQIDNDDLDDFGKLLLAACKDPLSAHSFKEQVHELEDVNAQLMDRISTLEKAIEDHQVTTIPSTKTLSTQTIINTVHTSDEKQRRPLQANLHS